MALNVVCCETAIRLKLGSKRKCPGRSRNDVDDPERSSAAAAEQVERIKSNSLGAYALPILYPNYVLVLTAHNTVKIISRSLY
jgi:hypothetical protein